MDMDFSYGSVDEVALTQSQPKQSERITQAAGTDTFPPEDVEHRREAGAQRGDWVKCAIHPL